MSTYIYKTSGTCATQIAVELEGKTIEKVEFTGGCNGNLSGIGKLVEGMEIDHVIERFTGNRCGNRTTSCPDQLAKALQAAYADQSAK